MVPIVMALGTAVIWGGVDFVAGVKSRSSGPLAVLWVSQLSGLVLIAAVVGATGEQAPAWEYVLEAAAAGAAAVVGLVALYRALAVGLMSVVAPITATGAVIPVAVGVARGEAPTWVQGAGMVLALGGVVLASREARGAAAARAPLAAGVGLALVGALGLGGFFIAFGAASEGSIAWAVLMQRATLVALVLAPALVLRHKLSLRRSDLPPVVAMGLCDIGALLLLAAASTRGLLGLVAVIASLYPVGTVVLAHLVLGERIGGAQRAGVVSALAGVALVSAG